MGASMGGTDEVGREERPVESTSSSVKSPARVQTNAAESASEKLLLCARGPPTPRGTGRRVDPLPLDDEVRARASGAERVVERRRLGSAGREARCVEGLGEAGGLEEVVMRRIEGRESGDELGEGDVSWSSAEKGSGCACEAVVSVRGTERAMRGSPSPSERSEQGASDEGA